MSYPRSGNTWIRYLLANLLCPSEEWTIVNIGRIIPDIHEAVHEDPIESEPRIIKSHRLYDASCRKVIYLYRDGRDVSVSLFEFLVKLRGYQSNFQTFLSEMLDGKLEFGSWQNHVTSWMNQRDQLQLLPICYEELCQNTGFELDRLGAFIGTTWSDDSLRHAISASTLTKQSKDFRKYKRESHWERGFQGGVRGGPGAWKDVFTPELQQLFWSRAGNVASSLGYRPD